MRRTVAAVLILIMTVSLSCCGKQTDVPEVPAADPVPATEAVIEAIETPEPVQEEVVLTEEEREEMLKEILDGKNFSILGDSISTYLGYSNNGDYNSTIKYNAVFYGIETRKLDLDEIYWRILLDRYNLNLLVNNSYSGATMRHCDYTPSGYTRAAQLHSDNDAVNPSGTKPDIVLIYMGTNDYDSFIRPGRIEDVDMENYRVKDGEFTYSAAKNFTDAYAYAIYKINYLYDGPDVFVTSLLPNRVNFNEEMRQEYNTVIRQVADLYDNVIYIDFDELTPYTRDNCYEYYVDAVLHPNAKGMECLADAIGRAFLEHYVP